MDENTVQTTKMTYNRVGNPVQSIDALGRITQYRYDALNRLTQVIDPNNQTTSFGYDNRGNILSVTYPNGQTTQYQFDNMDRKRKEIFPGGQTINYDYDFVGNLTQTNDPDGRITVNDYDDGNRLIKKMHFAPGQSTPERTVTYTYDNNGNLTGWNDGEHSETYVRDENNQKTQTVTTYNLNSASPIVLTNNLTYDAAQNKKTQTGPDNVTIEYRWDKDRLQQVIIPGEGNIAYVDYQWNQPSTIRYPGGAERTLTYDALMRLTDIQTKDQQQQDLFGLNYQYDLSNNITQKANAQTKTDYQYDVLQRLTEAKKSTVTPYPQNSTTLNTEGWQYDPNGNRTQDNEQPGTWTYDDNDRLQQSPKKTYEYDNAGNPTKITDTTDNSIQQHIYNAEGRLSKITNITDINNPAVIAEYQYDPLGRRIKKTTSTETRYFHYNDEGLIGEYHDNGNVIQEYGYVPGSIWTTNPLYTKTQQIYAYYYNDHLGTPQELRDADNNILWAGDAKAFGQTMETLNLISNPLRLSGQYEDQEIGLHFNYFRNYDTESGRYIQRDPVGLQGGLNTYIYVAANPILFSDPYGLKITGKLVDTKVLPHELRFDVIDTGFELDYDTGGGTNIPGLGPRLAWAKLKVGGKLRLLIHCKETAGCDQPEKEGYIEKAIKVPKIIPYTYHYEQGIVSATFSIPYSLVKIAIAVEPYLKHLAKLNELNIPLICSLNKNWMPEIPFSWSDELPISP